jgi:hypothetical protein
MQRGMRDYRVRRVPLAAAGGEKRHRFLALRQGTLPTQVPQIRSR